MDGLILAGGKSRRMGGRHKGEMACCPSVRSGHALSDESRLSNQAGAGGRQEGETFLGRMIAEFRKETDTVMISYGEKVHREYEDCKIVRDIYPDCGPIGGLHAGFRESDSEKIMVAACDMPFLGIELYRFLIDEMEREEKRRGCLLGGVVPMSDGRIHPLAAVYRKGMGVILEEQIAVGEYRLRKALERLEILYVDVSKNPEMCRMLRNINTVEEYEQLSVMQKVIAVCGVKNSGKTTLLEKLIENLSARGLKIAVVKHDGHDFTCDIPGTDSYRLGEAGAYGTAVFSNSRIFIHKKGTGEREEELIRLFPEADIIFLEGMKDSSYPKIEVIREGISDSPASNPAGRFLIVTDRNPQEYYEKTAGINEIDKVAEEILKYCNGSCISLAETL